MSSKEVIVSISLDGQDIRLGTLWCHLRGNNETAEDLKLLLAPGSSLGGARPKASVRDRDGSLAIAKFSKKDDEFNVVAWEAVALELAQKAGIKVPSYRLEEILEKPVLIISRFDRSNKRRIQKKI